MRVRRTMLFRNGPTLVVVLVIFLGRMSLLCVVPCRRLSLVVVIDWRLGMRLLDSWVVIIIVLLLLIMSRVVTFRRLLVRRF